MKRLLFLFLLAFTVIALPAADKTKKEPAPPKLKALFKNAATARKNSAKQAEAEAELIAALAREDLTDKSRAEICYECAELQENLNGVVNKLAYLKKPYDTAAFFNYLKNMYNHLEKCDSFDAVPNEQGKVKLSFKGQTRSLRMKHRRNMYNGGLFFLGKNDYANAYTFFDNYYRITDPQRDERLPKVAYWAALCGYMSQQPDATLRYIDEAIEVGETDQKPLLYEYKARTYLLKKDEASWVGALNAGLAKYPTHDYFFVNKEDWYHSQRRFDEGINLADSMIQNVADKALYWYAKCRMELAKNNFESCIVNADSTIRRDDKYVNAYYNKGISCLNLAVLAQETACQDPTNPKWQEDRKKIQGYYSEAKPCMEMVRQLEPENVDRWGTPLYRIYLNLNMGKEFDEIDKLLKSAQK